MESYLSLNRLVVLILWSGGLQRFLTYAQKNVPDCEDTQETYNETDNLVRSKAAKYCYRTLCKHNLSSEQKKECRYDHSLGRRLSERR